MNYYKLILYLTSILIAACVTTIAEPTDTIYQVSVALVIITVCFVDFKEN